MDLSDNGFTNLDRGLGKISIEINIIITIVLTYLEETYLFMSLISVKVKRSLNSEKLFSKKLKSSASN